MNGIHLRQLKITDAPLMLEWMQEPSIACFFRFDAQKMTLADCEKFITGVSSDNSSQHFAIADENDEYLGTISLKHIDIEKREAEYAISTRKKVHGTGAAMIATKEILRVAFEDLGLKRVYLNVLKENGRANAFYRKAGFQFDYCEEKGVILRNEHEQKALNWYYIISDSN